MATAQLMEIAEKHAKGRIVSVLEGGYDLEGLDPLRRRACRNADGRVISALTGKVLESYQNLNTCGFRRY